MFVMENMCVLLCECVYGGVRPRIITAMERTDCDLFDLFKCTIYSQRSLNILESIMKRKIELL